MRSLLTLCGLLCLVVVPAAAQGGNRVRVDVRHPPWNAVGKLQALSETTRTTCTATLIGPRTALTAAHCLYDPRTRSRFPVAALQVMFGLDGQRMAAGALVERVAMGAGFDPDDPVGTMGGDWALLTLAAPLTVEGGYLPLDPQPPASGTAVMVGGYAQNDPNTLAADTNCRVTAAAVDSGGRRLVLHNCTIVLGVSGAPLLRSVRHGWAIVGVNIGRSREGDRGFATAVEQVRPRL